MLNLARAALDAHPDAGHFRLHRLDPASGRPAASLDRAALRARVDALRGAVLERTTPRERVLVASSDPLGTAIAFLATLDAGRIPVPVRHDMPPADLQRLAAVAGATLRVGTNDALDEAWRFDSLPDTGHDRTPDSSPVPPPDAAFLIFTSGTSGRPRAALHGHRWVDGRRAIIDGWSGLVAGERALHTGQMHWTYALGSALIDPLLADVESAVFADAPSVDLLLRALEGTAWDVLATVPAHLRRVLDAEQRRDGVLRRATERVGRVLCAGEHLPGAMREAWTERGGPPVHEAWGTTECSTPVSTRAPETTKAGWVGRARERRRVALLDPETRTPFDGPGLGWLAVHPSDPAFFLGYWDAQTGLDVPDASTWFVPGDVAERASDGMIRVLGRNDDQLNVMGVRLSPLEIEEILRRHDPRHELAVGSIERAGKELLTVWLEVQDMDEASAWARLDGLRAYAEVQLAAYRRPRVWLTCLALPRNASGKLERRRLREVAVVVDGDDVPR